MPLATISAIDTSTDVLTTATAHGLATGYAVGWIAGDGAVLPTATPAISLSGVYFVRAIDATTLTLHGTAAGAAANTGKINFSAAGSGSLNLQRLTVRERIERNVMATLAAIGGISAIERWDARGNTRAALSVVLKPDDETAVRDEQAYGTLMKYLPIDVEITLVQNTDTSETTSAMANRWVGELESALLADVHRGELAHDTDVVGVIAPDSIDDQPECVATLQIEIQYRHLKADPYSQI